MIREISDYCKIRFGKEILTISLDELRERFEVDSVIRFKSEYFNVLERSGSLGFKSSHPQIIKGYSSLWLFPFFSLII